MSNEERSNSPKNILGMLIVMMIAIIINPWIKLRDLIKGEQE